MNKKGKKRSSCHPLPLPSPPPPPPPLESESTSDSRDCWPAARPVPQKAGADFESSQKAPVREEAGSFATKFDSPTVCVTTSGSGRKYFLHKRLLIEKCPYFTTLFSSKLPTIEVSANAVQLDGNGCTEGAFDALVDYIYRGSYESGVTGERDAKCTTHASVYVLAERLCMGDLKQEALVNMARELRMASEWDGNLSAEAATRLIHIVYLGTPDRAITPHAERGDEAGDSAIPDTNGCSEPSTAETLPDAPPSSQRPLDKMRNLIANYASSILSTLKKHPDFLDCLQSDSEFLEDILVHLPDRSDPPDYDSLC